MQEEFVYVTNERALGRRSAEITGSRLVTFPFNDPDAVVEVGSETTGALEAWGAFSTVNVSIRGTIAHDISLPELWLPTLKKHNQLQYLFSLTVSEPSLWVNFDRDKWYGTGPLSRWLPALDCLAIDQSCIVTDGTDEAIAAVVRHLGELLSVNFLGRIELKNLEVGSPLEVALTAELTADFRFQRKAYVRFCRRLRNQETREPIQASSLKNLKKIVNGSASWKRNSTANSNSLS